MFIQKLRWGAKRKKTKNAGKSGRRAVCKKKKRALEKRRHWGGQTAGRDDQSGGSWLVGKLEERVGLVRMKRGRYREKRSEKGVKGPEKSGK